MPWESSGETIFMDETGEKGRRKKEGGKDEIPKQGLGALKSSEVLSRKKN